MTLRKIESIFADFFWGSSEHGRNKHWVAWKKWCFPTEENGIGIRRLVDVVKAIDIKLWWKFRTFFFWKNSQVAEGGVPVLLSWKINT